MLKIAVASSDGSTINVHFGQAKSFLLFEVEEDGTYRQTGEREILSFVGCGSGDDHGHDGTASQLAGVDAVLAEQIGPGAVNALQARGIKAFGVRGPIEKTLASYGKRHKLLDQPLPGIGSGGCGGGCGGGKGGCR